MKKNSTHVCSSVYRHTHTQTIRNIPHQSLLLLTVINNGTLLRRYRRLDGFGIGALSQATGGHHIVGGDSLWTDRCGTALCHLCGFTADDYIAFVGWIRIVSGVQLVDDNGNVIGGSRLGFFAVAVEGEGQSWCSVGGDDVRCIAECIEVLGAQRQLADVRVGRSWRSGSVFGGSCSDDLIGMGMRQFEDHGLVVDGHWDSDGGLDDGTLWSR